MKTVILLGKRRSKESPRAQWPEAELWGVSGSQQRYSKKYGPLDDWTSWHDYHPVEKTKFYRGIKAIRPQTYEWYKTLPGPDAPNYRPLYLLDVDPKIPASVRFPQEDVAAAFPHLRDDGRLMITCQVDWMMAWAMLLGFEHIILSGHGVNRDPLHMIQHRGILYWIAAARASGVLVTVVSPSWYSAPEKPYGTEAGSWTPS